MLQIDWTVPRLRTDTASEPGVPRPLTRFCSWAQLICTNSGRNTLSTSCTENSVRALWSSQASHHR